MLERQRLPLNIKEEMAVMERLHASTQVSIERLRTGGLVVPAAPCPWLYPDVIFPAPEVFVQEGEAKIRSLVTLHHELIWEHPLRAIFGNDRQHFDRMVAITADFHVEACGGPTYYSSRRGEPHLNVRHMPFTITEHDREDWLALYVSALRQSGFSLDSKERYWRWVESLSLRMINRRARVAPPKRIFFADVKKLLTGEEE